MSQDLMAATVAAVRTHGSVTDAARALKLPYATVQSRFKAAQVAGLADDLVASRAGTTSVVPLERLPVTVDECWTMLDGWIGRKRTPTPKPPKYRGGKTQRIAIISDLHEPFCDRDALASFIAAEADKTDLLIVNGDLMDFYGVSRFLKYETVPIEQEIAATDATLSRLAAEFPDVLVVDGNHDAPRFEKNLRALLSPEMMHVVEFLAGGNLSVVKALAKRHKNVRFAPLKVGRFSLGWMAQIGDLVVTHAEKYSRVPSAALRSIDEWMTDQHHTLGLDDWRVLVQAHTHQGGVFPWKADRLLVECGCLCETHGYQLTAKIGGRPQRRGYVTLTQYDGVTDMNSVRFVWLDVARQVA